MLSVWTAPWQLRLAPKTQLIDSPEKPCQASALFVVAVREDEDGSLGSPWVGEEVYKSSGGRALRINTKAQLTQTACKRLFCCLSVARIGVSYSRSRLQVAVDCTPKWTATCSRLGRQDSGRLLSQLRMECDEEALLWLILLLYKSLLKSQIEGNCWI